MKSFYLLIIAIILITSCSQKPEPQGTEKIGGSSDFFKITLNSSSSEWIRPTDCRAHISEVVCEVEPEDDWTKSLERPCLGGEQKYVSVLEKIYDNLDPMNQKMFCSLRRIFIEREFFATGYASLIFVKDETEGYKKLPGAILGYRKSIFEQQPDFTKWLTWKEQKNFAKTSDENFEVVLDFPKYEMSQNFDLIQDVTVHEFGHMFDFSNKLVQEVETVPDCLNENIDSLEKYLEKCKPIMIENTFGDISWINSGFAKSNSDFDGRNRLCFYYCETFMTPQEMVNMYVGLSTSDFVTSYAASNPRDDFAETWAIRWMLEYKNAHLILKASENFSFSTYDIYNSEKFKPKRQFLDRFLTSNIQYP